MAAVPAPSRGEIWLVDFDPSIGSEIRKVRPALVVSLDSIGRLPLRLVVPIVVDPNSCTTGLVSLTGIRAT